MASRDILDSGTLTISANGTADGPWLPTQGIRDVVVLLKLSSVSVGEVVQESSDGTNVLYETGFTSSYRLLLQPGAAYLRLHVTNGSASQQTVDYSIRALP